MDTPVDGAVAAGAAGSASSSIAGRRAGGPGRIPLRTAGIRKGSARSIASGESGFTDYAAGKNAASSANCTPAFLSAVLFASIPLGAGQSLDVMKQRVRMLNDR
jgi:hypothetical protein